MKAVLVVIKDKKQVAKVSITKKVFVIGRSKKCDLSIDEQVASRQHIEIRQEEGGFWVQDLQSRNGTSLNGKPITDRKPLSDGDEIGIGATRLSFYAGQSETAGTPEENPTRFASPSAFESELPGQKIAAKKNKGSVNVALKIISGPLAGGIFRDWEGSLTIGRSLDNHVVLLDDAVSGHHAQVDQEGINYFLQDLDSANGTFLDGIKVQRTPLVNGQKIKVGISMLQFERVDLEQRKKIWLAVTGGLAGLLLIAAVVKMLLPADIAGEQIAKTKVLYSQGNLSNALEAIQIALKIDPSRPEAKNIYNQIKAELEARAVLDEAAQSASQENYTKAKELCFRVLRDFPRNGRALELKTIIESIENAKIAFGARNWTDAVRLLEKARDAYPKSKLIEMRLSEAIRELNAQQNLALAKDALQHQQPDMAEKDLLTIPTNSCYFTEARENLDKINNERRIADSLGRATANYRAGQITEALTEIEKGLQAVPDSGPLLVLRDRVRLMESLAGPLTVAETLTEPENIEWLIQQQKTCDAVLQAEEDPLNVLRKRAETARTPIVRRLHELSQSTAVKAADTLQAGNRKESLRLYGLAIKADSANQDAAQALESLRKAVVGDCIKLYKAGIVYEDLQQADRAMESFHKVLEMGIPGEEYYEKADRKVKEYAH